MLGRGAVGAVAVVCVLLVACGDAGVGGDGLAMVTGASVAEATQSASSARQRVELVYDDELPSSVSEGLIDFDTGDGEFTTSAAGSPSSPGTVTRMVGGELFLGTGGDEDTGPSWVRIGLPSDAGGTIGRLAMDPLSVVRELTDTAADLRPAGHGEVRGDPTASYRFDLPAGSPLLPGLMVPAGVAAAGTMDVDDSGRLRRLVVEPDRRPTAAQGEDPPAMPIPLRVEMELWDFGVDVEIEEPDPGSVVDFGNPGAEDVLARIAETSGVDRPEPSDVLDQDDLPQRVGRFALAADGTWEDVSWEIWEAPASDGGACYSLELDPPPFDGWRGEALDQVDPDGHRDVCGPRADLFDRGDPVQLLGSWSASADYWHVAGTTAPEITRLAVELDSGRTLDVPVDPDSHVFALFSRTPLRVTRVVPDAGDTASIECEPDETDGYGITYLNCSGTVYP
jgi:hypothetical protein